MIKPSIDNIIPVVHSTEVADQGGNLAVAPHPISVGLPQQGAPSFSTLIFHDFHNPKNENPWPIGTMIPSKRYTTYECISELVLTVPVRIGQ